MPFLFYLQILVPIVGIFLLFEAIKHRRFLRICITTLPRDVYAGILFIYVNCYLLYTKYTNQTTVKVFDSQVKKRGTKRCFFFEDEVWTYEKVQRESYKVANYFQSRGYKKGDTVSLIMENRPEYVCVWLGLSRIGVITGLLNYNVRLKGLEHCVSVAGSKAIIYGSEMSSALQQVIDSGGFQNLELFCLQDRISEGAEITVPFVDLTKQLQSIPATPTQCRDDIGNDDIVLLVYTSGTTGLPKASLLRHGRVFAMSTTTIAARLKADHDILVTPVPLYHVQGGILGVTAAIFYGVPQVILRKFSASRFWHQCIKYEATASQYLGEIIRYLYNQPEKPEDKLHKVKTFIGNGVNPAIWSKFVERFNNVKIKELYGATEGNCNLMNVVGHIGACAFLPVWALPFLPYFFAKVDDSTGELLRDKRGLAIPAAFNEPGELLGQITSNPMRQFDGYTDPEATKKKILTNIRKKGDQWFRSGDLIVVDEYGYWYFKDRSGDTFRWKGENVSTSEVEMTVTRASGMKACVVFGVQVPGMEGRAGMACIADPERTLDLVSFASEIERSLPSYARPIFLRVIHQEMSMTGTFKLQKVDLQKQGFAREEKGGESLLYFLKHGEYLPLGDELYGDVISGKIRF